MIEYLFGSKTRLKLLQIFYREPEARFFVRELSRLADTQINAIRRELATLVVTTVIREDADAGSEETRRKFYSLNTDSLLHHELGALLMRGKLLSEQAFIADIKNLGSVSLMLLSGRFVGDENLPTDILIVGHVSEQVVKRLMVQFEKKLGFAVRYTLFSPEEYAERKRMLDRFVYAILEGRHTVMIDETRSV